MPRRVWLRCNAGHGDQYSEIHIFSLRVLRATAAPFIYGVTNSSDAISGQVTPSTHISPAEMASIGLAINSLPVVLYLTVRHPKHEPPIAMPATEYSESFRRIFIPRWCAIVGCAAQRSPSLAASGARAHRVMAGRIIGMHFRRSACTSSATVFRAHN